MTVSTVRRLAIGGSRKSEIGMVVSWAHGLATAFCFMYFIGAWIVIIQKVIAT